MTRVGIIDNDSLAVGMFCGLLAEPQADCQVVWTAATMAAAVATRRRSGSVDLILLDGLLGDGSRLMDNIVALRKDPATLLVISSEADRSEIGQAIQSRTC